MALLPIIGDWSRIQSRVQSDLSALNDCSTHSQSPAEETGRILEAKRLTNLTVTAYGGGGIASHPMEQRRARSTAETVVTASRVAAAAEAPEEDGEQASEQQGQAPTLATSRRALPRVRLAPLHAVRFRPGNGGRGGAVVGRPRTLVRRDAAALDAACPARREAGQGPCENATNGRQLLCWLD